MTNDFQYEEANPAKSLLAIPGSFLLDFILFLNIQITNDKKNKHVIWGVIHHRPVSLLNLRLPIGEQVTVYDQP